MLSYIRKYILSFVLLLNLIVFIVSYFKEGQLKLTNLIIVFALAPMAITQINSEFKRNKNINLMQALGLLLALIALFLKFYGYFD